jgi:hypothetical protein
LIYGAVAQLGERMTGSHEANGSIPFSSTNKSKRLRRKLKTSFLFYTQFAPDLPRIFYDGSIVAITKNNKFLTPAQRI